MLCDSPGFEDSEGVEVDVANGVGTVRAIQKSKSVRPLLLLSYKSMGARSEGLKNLVRTIQRFVVDIEAHLPAFSYLFTRVPSDELGGLHGTFGMVYSSLSAEEKTDKARSSLWV